jgi:branched-chain amino acid transport system permease protein
MILDSFLNIIVSGLINGSIYALLAIAFSLILGVARIVNIAHTAFYMLAAYFIYIGLEFAGLPVLVSMILSVPATVLLGLIAYRLFIKPIQEHEATVLIATIALAMVIQEILLLIFAGSFRGAPNLVSGYIEVSGFRITNQQLLTIGVALVTLVVIWTFLMKTRLGLAVRSTAQDREIANLMGMNVTRVAMWTMAVSMALAAVAGAIVAPLRILEPHMWMHPLIMMLAIVVLGGLGSVMGSFVGAYILSLTESMVVVLLPGGAFLKDSVALSIMILVLVIRPEGLFGVKFEEER